MRELALDDIEALAVGAWILGTGGGGSPYLGLLNMRRLYAEGHRVVLMPPFDLADQDWVAVVSNMGAPLIGQERLALQGAAHRPRGQGMGHPLHRDEGDRYRPAGA